ncbi:fgf [Sucra jujuba nucleopolyhedrovirus]|uniref:Fgf n=1 Tax=Sucra jujuba nucleopolyhedrovirus TaxID=1563660 RepID=A0A097P961_9ABAC|nr:fgf [Sucra jujuba nucleopolyhedrovirus]AIU41366.1 fgf [Sucra jujuba nucleopolyhedrovirus]
MFSVTLFLSALSVATSAFLGSGAHPLDSVSGSATHVQFFINKRLLQMSAEGIVNGTNESMHDENTVWKRIAVDKKSDIVIRNVKNCRFLCINDCGYTYSATVPNKECLWTEAMNGHYSYYYRQLPKRKMYLGLNLEGKTRKIVLPVDDPVGKFASQTFTTIRHWTSAAPRGDVCETWDQVKGNLTIKPKNTCRSFSKTKVETQFELTNSIPLERDNKLNDEDVEYTNVLDESKEVVSAVKNETTENVNSTTSAEVNSTINVDSVYVSGSLNKNLYSFDNDPEIEVLVLSSPSIATTTKPGTADELVNNLLNKTKNVVVNNGTKTIRVNTYTFNNCNFINV